MDRLARGGLSAGALGQLDARAAGAALVAASQARRPGGQFFDDRLRDRRRADRPRRATAARRIWRLSTLSSRQPVARLFGRPEDTLRARKSTRLNYSHTCATRMPFS